jgi:hypothetical protein
MALLKANRNETVQWERVAMQRFTLAELPTGSQVPVIRLPAGAIVLGGFLKTTVASNDTGTGTVDIGDIADSDRYSATPVNVKTVGAAVLFDATGNTNVPYQYTEGTWLTLTYVGANADATTLSGYVVVRYIVEGRFNEIEPEDTVPADDATPN